MHQQIAAMAGAGDCLSRSRITGDHYAAVRGVKTVSIRKIPGAMRDGKSADGNIGVLIDDPRMNPMGVDAICLGVAVLQAMYANVHVFYICGLNVACHAGDSGWAV